MFSGEEPRMPMRAAPLSAADNGIDRRPTDVHGQVIPGLLA
jgi:hypothetical protein